MKSLLAILALASIAGCATVQPVSQAQLASSTEHKVDRNYTIGAPSSAYVGQPLVRVKDYWIKTSTKAALKPSEAFTLDMPLFGPTIHVSPDQGVEVIGTNERDGVTYRVVKLPGLDFLGFLVNDDGTFDGRAVNFAGAKMGYTYKFQPSDVRLIPGSVEEVFADRGYVNFELVYSGSTKDEINLLYREYTPSDMARPAFTQNLTYATDAKTIRFRDIKIDVLGVDSEQIRYVVQQDGLGG